MDPFGDDLDDCSGDFLYLLHHWDSDVDFYSVAVSDTRVDGAVDEGELCLVETLGPEILGFAGGVLDQEGAAVEVV